MKTVDDLDIDRKAIKELRTQINKLEEELQWLPKEPMYRDTRFDTWADIQALKSILRDHLERWN